MIAELLQSSDFDLKDGFANRFLFAEQITIQDLDTGIMKRSLKIGTPADLEPVPYNRIWNVKPTEFIFR